MFGPSEHPDIDVDAVKIKSAAKPDNNTEPVFHINEHDSGMWEHIIPGPLLSLKWRTFDEKIENTSRQQFSLLWFLAWINAVFMELGQRTTFHEKDVN